jgi:hypothetical protein
MKNIGKEITDWARECGYECDVFESVGIYFLFKNNDMITWHPDPNVIVSTIQYILNMRQEVEIALNLPL